MQLVAITQEEFDRLDPIKVDIPLGNNQENNPTGHPVPPIAMSIETAEGVHASRFNLEAARKHPLWNDFYKPTGLSEAKPCGIWSDD